jgi:hypothetical protein
VTEDFIQWNDEMDDYLDTPIYGQLILDFGDDFFGI